MSKQKKYHYIYKTTCKITGKFYVGMHSTDNLEDGYLGSGKILGYSRNKYGDENHIKEIVEHCLSRDELKRREKEIVNEDLLADPLNINLKYGGEGGWDIINECRQNLYPGIIENAIKNFTKGLVTKNNRLANDKSYKNKVGRNISIGVLKTVHLRTQPAHLSDSHRANLKTALANRRPHDAEKNSQYGTCWVTNGIKPIKIKKEYLDEYLLNGYSRGRS